MEKEKSIFEFLELSPIDIEISAGKFELDIVPVTDDWRTLVVNGDKRLGVWMSDRIKKAQELQSKLDHKKLSPPDLKTGYSYMWMKYYRLVFEHGRICCVNFKREKNKF